MSVIIVSGTPGTGKTTFAKKYAKENNLKYIDVKKIIEKNDLSDKFDEKRDTLVIDVDKLNIFLIKIIKTHKDIVIDSHLSHYLPKKYVNKCYITKCNLIELKKRLKTRNYSTEKIRENMDAEIFDICRIEALEAGHNVETICTDNTI